MAPSEPVNRLQLAVPDGCRTNEEQQGPDMSHLADRFAEAVRTLVSDGPIKQRLSRAYSENLEGLDQAELPPGLRREFSDLEVAFSRIAPVGNETRVRANVQKMSASEAGQSARIDDRLKASVAGQSVFVPNPSASRW